MPTNDDLRAGIALSAAFVALIIAAEVWRKLASPPVEWTRKLVHLGGGIVALAIPFVIASQWVVLVMAAVLGGLFAGSRRLGWLPSLHRIGRRTLGVEFYPVAVYLLYLLAHHQPWKYVICLLILAVGDAFAALIGRRFGRIKYEIDGNHKSLEGSATFFVLTFIVIAGVLLAWHDPTLPPAPNCLLVALLAAALATGIEAIALDGRDNLWLPLGVYIVLTKLLRQPVDELVRQNAAFAVLTAMLMLGNYVTRALNVGAALVFLLAVYGAWSLGSPDWAWPAGCGLALYLVVRAAGASKTKVRSRRMTRRLLLPFLVLCAANVAWQFDRFEWYDWLFGPYLVGCLAANIVGMGIGLESRHLETPSRRRSDMAMVSVASAAANIGPCLWLQPDASPVAALIVAAIGLAVGQAYASFTPVAERTAERRSSWSYELVAAAMLLIAAAQAIGISPIWYPR